jgi:hypothetical protein
MSACGLLTRPAAGGFCAVRSPSVLYDAAGARLPPRVLAATAGFHVVGDAVDDVVVVPRLAVERVARVLLVD